jgi:signal transduction histidine kinase
MLGRSMDAARTIERQILFTRDYEEIGVNAPRWFDVEETVRVAASGLPEALRILAADVGDLEVYADPLLQKVFYNLVENALRHGGAVTRIGVSAEPSGNDQVLVFEDDGAGVPAGLKEQIFRREYYVHTGFGLFLSREILAITGIAIRETGTPGKGARFELLVPGGAFRYR